MGENQLRNKQQLIRNHGESRVPLTMRDFFFDDPFFKNSWEDFEKVRERMFAESRENWKKFDEDFRNLACMSNNIMLESSQDSQSLCNEMTNDNRSLMRQDSKSRWENGWMFPRRWMLPGLSSDITKDLDIFKSKDNEVIRVKEDEKKMKVSVDKGVVTVEGKHEEKAEDGSKMVSRMFSRKYSLPPDAKAEDVVSNLSSDGVLVITAPKKNLAIK